MIRALAAAVATAAAAGCATDPPSTAAPPAPPGAAEGAAGAPTAEPAPPPAPSGAGPTFAPFDPASGFHLDDDAAPAAPRRADRAAPRDRRVLQLVLQSTPGGAIAAVDGKVVGRTPVFWEGEFTGREREFTFVLPGYAMARYRFVPIRDGFVHGRLERIADGDAGMPEIPQPPQRP